MSLDSIFLFNNQGEILAEKNYKSETFRSVANEFYNIYIQDKLNLDQEYPIIKVAEYICPYITNNDVIITCILSKDVPILNIYGILYGICETIKNVFGIINSDIIRRNYCQIIVLLDHCMDYGYPLIQQKYVLESIIQPQGVMEKIGEVLTGNTSDQKVLEKYAETLADVRNISFTKVNYLKLSNQIMFDTIEYLDCILEKNGNAIQSDINGEIKVNNLLSTQNNVNVFLGQQSQFFDYACHECLIQQIDSYKKEKVLSFLPPTGQFILFNYTLKDKEAKLPFEVIHSMKITENQVSIDIKIESRPIRGDYMIIEDFHVKLILPEGLISSECVKSQGITNLNKNCTNLLWKVGDIKKEVQSKLQLKFNIEPNYDVENKNYLMCLKFNIPGYSYSNTKIDKVDVKDTDPRTIIKKSRNIAKSGYFEIRLN